MKKRIALPLTMAALVLFSACQNGTKTEAPQNEETEESEAAAAMETERPDAVLTVMNHVSPDGWSVRYDPRSIEEKEIDEHSVQFVYTGESAGTDLVTVSYLSGKQPEEVLYDVTEPWGDQESIMRIEGFFPGTEDMWGYWRVQNPSDEGEKISRTAIAGEFNGGVLLFEEQICMEEDEERGMLINDTLAEIIDSVTYENFEKQTMYSYIPGIYYDVDEPQYSVELREDHTGNLHFQDDVGITWGSAELKTGDGTAYEYSIEGDFLYLDYEGYHLSFDRNGNVSSQVKELPPYTYYGEDPMADVICDYLVDVMGAGYEGHDVMIPVMNIIAKDESDSEDIKVWGDFWIFGYKLEGDTLVTKNGGDDPGMMHLKKGSNGDYEVTGFDMVADGSDFIPSAKEIFGEYYEKFSKVQSDDMAREELRKMILSEYVKNNGLPIKYYRDEGWEPVSLE